MHNVGIASDGSHYFTCNGGNASFGQINTYDLNGNFQRSVSCFLDLRAIFYNPADGRLYGKTYDQNLYRIDPVTGGTILIFANIFQFTQSSPAFAANGQVILEHENGTIRFISFATGQLINTLTGFYHGGYPSSEAVGTDGTRIFTWDENLVTVYDFGGNGIESFTIPNGHWGFSLKFVNGLLFTSDDGGGSVGTWYGYRVGAVNQPLLFDHPPTPVCGSVLTVLAGHSLSFAVRVSDADSADVATLTSSSLPPAAIVVPPLPAAGNPVSATFSWIPTNGDIGLHSVSFTARTNDPNDSTVSCNVTISVLPDTSNHAPDCSQAVASEPVLWPPNHNYHPISVLGVTDPDGDPVRIIIASVTQDEPVNGRGDGNTCPDATLVGGSASVRAERTGTSGIPGNGRVYAINFTADDGKGGQCNGTVQVCVPHDRGNPTCIDDGQRYSSLGPCTHGNGLSSETVTNYSLEVGPMTGSEVSVSFGLPADAQVQVTVFDVAGRQRATLENAQLSRGVYQRTWNMAGVSNGMYFVRMRAGGVTLTRAMVRAR